VAQRNHELNAVVRIFDDAIVGNPEGAFAGVPLLLKDALDAVAGDLLTSGSRAMSAWRARHHSVHVRALLEAGFTLIGRTNTPEFGMMTTTESILHGACRNPHDVSRTPGGSSGGAGAAVASGMVPIAHATDAGGSIRIPASCCGVFGLKPSRGLTHTGAEDVLGGLTSTHAVTRSVRDSAMLLAATSSSFGAPPGEEPRAWVERSLDRPPDALRVLVVDRVWWDGAPQPEVAAVLHDAASHLAAIGHRVEQGVLPGCDEETLRAFETFYASNAHELFVGLGAQRGRAIESHEVEPFTWALAERGAGLRAVERFTAVAALYDMAAEVLAMWSDCDVVLTPTSRTPPLLVGALNGRSSDVDAVLEAKRAFAPFTALFNITGQPAAGVPFGMSSGGLPLGVQLVGAPSSDLLLLRLAKQLEDTHTPPHASVASK